MDRRDFLQVSALAGVSAFIGSSAQVSARMEIDLAEATVSGLQAAMASGETTARKIAEGYLFRIAEIVSRAMTRLPIAAWIGTSNCCRGISPRSLAAIVTP